MMTMMMRLFLTFASSAILFAVSSLSFHVLTTTPTTRRLGYSPSTLSIAVQPNVLEEQETVLTDTSEAALTDTPLTEATFTDAAATDAFLLESLETAAAAAASELVVPDSDVLLGLQGQPLTPDYFGKAMGIEVESYSAQDAFSGFMSHGCRVHFHPNGQTCFYKRVVFETLGHAREKLKKAPFKLARDAQSYQVVAAFLQSQACRSLCETTGLVIPRCYDAQLQPNQQHPMESQFSFLLEDLSPKAGWHQEWLLDAPATCRAALQAYAAMHAYFWQGSDFYSNQEAVEELQAAVWPSGSYVQPQAQDANQCAIVAQEWTQKRMRFEQELSHLSFWDDLGERLQSVAVEAGRLAHPFADNNNDDENDNDLNQYQKYKTFTHGDPKQANLLFRSKVKTDASAAADNNNDDEDLEVGLIDLQWAGFGLAATDVAHFITSAVHADQLVDGGEEELLAFYYEHLQTHLVEYGVFDSAKEAQAGYSFDTFLEQYETAILDLVRLVIAYTWSRFTEAVEKDDAEACARTMNKTSYNKSVPNVIWLLTKCDEILTKRGV